MLLNKACRDRFRSEAVSLEAHCTQCSIKRQSRSFLLCFTYHNRRFLHLRTIAGPWCPCWTADKRCRPVRGWWIQSSDSVPRSFDAAGRLKKGSIKSSASVQPWLSLTMASNSGLSSIWHTIASGTTWIFFFSFGNVCIMFFVKWTRALKTISERNRGTKGSYMDEGPPEQASNTFPFFLLPFLKRIRIDLNFPTNWNIKHVLLVLNIWQINPPPFFSFSIYWQ